MSTHKQTATKPQFASIILANLALIISALYFEWDIGTVIWAYWLEAVILVLFAALTHEGTWRWLIMLSPFGIYFVFLVLLTIPFDGVTYTINDQQVSGDEFVRFNNVSWAAVASSSSIFIVARLSEYSAERNKQSAVATTKSIFARTLPIHITIIFAAFVSFPVLLFMVAKTLAELATQIPQIGKHVLRRNNFVVIRGRRS